MNRLLIFSAVLCLFLYPISSFGVDLGSVGSVYDIAEKDLMEVIKDRASKVDWKALADKSKKDIVENVGKVDKQLPKATDNATYYVDLTTELDHDIYIRDNTGKPKILYPKGYKFNVLDYTQLKTTFVFFDASRDEEIAWYKSKYANTANAMPIITKGSAYKFAHEVGREVYIIDDSILKQFQLKATPTVVHQEKNKLRADEFYLQIKKVEQQQ